MKPIVAGSLVVLTAASLTANVLLYLRYSTSRPLVTVGSQVISKKAYQDEVDHQTQGSILKQMVLRDLVDQAAAREGVTPSDADVAARLADLQRRNPQALAGAAADPGKMAEFKSALKSDMALENLRIKGVTVSDAEVAAFYSRNAKTFTVPYQVQTTLVVTENSVDAADAESLLRQNISVDVIAHQPRLHVAGMNGFNLNVQSLPPAVNKKLSDTIFRMKGGQVQTIPIGKYYVVVRANKDSSAGVPPLAQIRPQVTRLAKLDKAIPASVEMAKLYQDARPEFNVEKYEGYFQDLSSMNVSQAPGDKKTASVQ